MERLREVSSRAVITPTSFSNFYNWGDFSRDPKELLRCCFDAHVYLSNWGTAHFMVRVPRDTISEDVLLSTRSSSCLTHTATDSHWIISWGTGDDEPDYDRFATDDGRGWMARLVPIREELLRGDLRSLYIGWLAAVTAARIPEDEKEPLVSDDLGNLTPAQEALAEFIGVDQDLLAAAVMGREAGPADNAGDGDRRQWLASLPRQEMEEILLHLLDGRSHRTERLLRENYAAWRRSRGVDHGGATPRTVEELWQYAEEAKRFRLEAEEQQRQRRAAEKLAQRFLYLRQLQEDLPRAWQRVRQAAARGSGRGYDEARDLLVDLAAAADVAGERRQFQTALAEFLAANRQRKALIQRLVRAGLCK